MHERPPKGESALPGDIAIPYERNPGAMWSWERVGYFHNALSKFGRMMDADFYAAPTATDTPSYHYLNSASLPSPVASVREEARRVFTEWSIGKLTDERKNEILRDTRREAATLVNMHNDQGVVLCRNTSEALSYFVWLSGILENKKENWPLVLSTDEENPSIQREIFVIRDHSNADRTDTITTHSAFTRPLRYEPPTPRPTGLRWGHFAVARATETESLAHLEEFIRYERPSVLLLSHVLRSTGRELPIAEWTRKARVWKKQYCPHDPDLFVCIDGAQALGNVNVDITALDCDMYVGCGHKALQGETTGLLFIDPSNPRIQRGLERVRSLTPADQVILRGMFQENLNVQPNVDDDVSYPDLAGFTTNIRRLQTAGLLQGHDVSALSAHRARLRTRCAEGLQRIAANFGCALSLLDARAGTPFILSFRIGADPFETQGGRFGSEGIFEPGAMHDEPLPTDSWGRRIAQRLHERGVGIAFLRRGAVFRVSFSDRTTENDIDAFLAAFKDTLDENGPAQGPPRIAS